MKCKVTQLECSKCTPCCEHRELSNKTDKVKKNKYCCHCTADLFDKGFKSSVRSRPTIIVEADDEQDAIKEAKLEFIRKYTDETVELNWFAVELIRKI